MGLLHPGSRPGQALCRDLAGVRPGVRLCRLRLMPSLGGSHVSASPARGQVLAGRCRARPRPALFWMLWVLDPWVLDALGPGYSGTGALRPAVLARVRL